MPTMWEKRLIEEAWLEADRKLEAAGRGDAADPYQALGIKKRRPPAPTATTETTAPQDNKENPDNTAGWRSYLFGRAPAATKLSHGAAPPGVATTAATTAPTKKAAAPSPAKAEVPSPAKAETKAAAAPAAEAAPATSAVDCSSGNVTQGASIFKAKCATCHTSNDGGPNKSGPNLFGVMGRSSGQATGFTYTSANKSSGVTWDNESMFAFLTNPKKFIKGTNMAFPGFKKEQDRADVIAYLNTLR